MVLWKVVGKLLAIITDARRFWNSVLAGEKKVTWSTLSLKSAENLCYI